MLVSGFDTLAPTIADPMDQCKTEPVQSTVALAQALKRAYMRIRANQQEKEIYGTDTVEIDDANLTSPWFLTEAAGFMGVPGRSDRVAERMRRRMRPEQLISNGLVRTVPPRRHRGWPGLAAKLLFGISIAVNACGNPRRRADQYRGADLERPGPFESCVRHATAS